jgi:DNA-directed RNA polymerase
MRDKETGYLTNLVPSNKCQDVYAVVAKAVTERLKVEAAEGVELAKIWLDFGVTRTVVKRNTMTYTYSGTQHGFGDQLKEDLMVPLINDVLYGRLKSHPFGSQREQNLAARYLAGINYDCIGDVLVAASRGMEYFRKVTGVVALENKALRWTNPVGFPVCQRYNKSKMLKVRMFLYDREAQVHKRSQVTIKVDEEHTVDRKKAMNGCAPNVIHSLDSAHMMSSVSMMLDNGVEDFFLIHDSFGTQCADTDVMYQCVRAAFVDLYQDGTCIFEDFDDQIRDQLRDPSNAKLPDIPRKGDLDINLVKESEYCFS